MIACYGHGDRGRERVIYGSSRPELLHPLGIFVQIIVTDRSTDFAEGHQEITSTHGGVERVFALFQQGLHLLSTQPLLPRLCSYMQHKER